MKNWVDKYLFPERGIYFAGAQNFNRVRKVMLKTWLPQRMLCTGWFVLRACARFVFSSKISPWEVGRGAYRT